MNEAGLSREYLALAAEFAVASELCRRGYYAQLTMGTHKKTDILVETDERMLRIQVKAKGGPQWPNCRGIPTRDFILVLVDFAGKGAGERPDFYVLDSNAWVQVANEEIQRQTSKGREVIIDDQNVPIWPKQINKSGKVYRGISLNRSQVMPYKEAWATVARVLEIP